MIAPEMLLAALERCGAAAAVLSFNNTATSTLQGQTWGRSGGFPPLSQGIQGSMFVRNF